VGKHDAMKLSELIREKMLLTRELECLFPPKSQHERKMRHGLLDRLAEVNDHIRITEYNMENPK
jgi:hypothetical protein